MTTQEIKKAVNEGQIVHYCSHAYRVVKAPIGYVIEHTSGNTIGLTWRDGITLNGNETDFFIGE